MRRPLLIILGSQFLAGTALAVGLGSCSDMSSGGASSTGVSSSGIGGGAADAGDAADHSDVHDAPVEASGEAGWIPVSWKAPCTVEVALHPEFAVPKLTWEPCPGTSPGCEGIMVNWDKGSGPPLAAVTAVSWKGGYRVGVQYNYPDSEARDAVFDVDGVAIAAWRVNGLCVLITPRVGSANVWVGAQSVDQQGGITSAYLGAPYDKVRSATQVIPVTLAGQDFDSNDTTFSLQGVTGANIAIYDRPGDQVNMFGPPPGLGYNVAHPVNDSALMQFYPVFGKPEAWIWNRSTHLTEPLIQPTSEQVMDIRSDGATIVWAQVAPKNAGDKYYMQGNLWTSPFATSKATLKPTKRRSLPMVGGITGAAGQGYYAMYGTTEDRKIHVYRLSDARHWEFVPPVEVGDIYELSYVDSKYVWYWTIIGVYRQAIDALGPGDPAP